MALTDKQISELRSIATSRYGSRQSPVTQPTVTAPQTARQRMMLDEEDEDKWYRGTMPTSSETLARIYTIGKSDPQQGQKLFDAFTSFQSDSKGNVTHCESPIDSIWRRRGNGSWNL